MDSLVSEVLRKKGDEVVTASPEATVAAAVQLMNERNVGAVCVVEDGKLCGIFTERDVLRRVIDGCLDPDTTPLFDVMTRQLTVIGPNATVTDALAAVNSRNCRHLPVLEGDELVGVLSIRDLTAWIVDGQEHQIAELVDYIYGGYGSTSGARIGQ